MVVCPY
jgi:hypothetical protein